MPLRRADDRRGAQHHQHPARRRRHRLPARPRRRQSADHGPRVLQAGKGGACARQGETAGDRLRRPRIQRRGRAAGHDRIRGFHRGGRSRLCMENARRRVGRDHAQLHVGHDRRPQGRGLSPPRRLSPRHRQRAHRQPGQALRLSLDPADVPLQRLVLPVDDLGGRRHACLPAPGARAGDVRRHRRSQGHASLRRADRDGDLAQRAGRGEEAAAARGRVLHRGRAAAGSRAGGDEGGRLQRHPRLRTDRDLRARDHQRMACRMGRAVARRAGREEGAPGRALRSARSARRARPRYARAGAVGRREHGRGDVPRQRRDEGLPEEQVRRPRRRSPAAGSIPATSA